MTRPNPPTDVPTGTGSAVPQPRSAADEPTTRSGTTADEAAASQSGAVTGGREITDVSVGELLGGVTRDLSTLVRQEMALARAELKQEATATAKGAGAFGGAAFAGYMTLLFLSVALWWALAQVVGERWSGTWAGLIVAAVWALIGAALYVMGRNRFREMNPKPERTVDTLKNVPEAVKGQRGGNP